MLTRRKFIRASTTILAAGVAADATIFEPNDPVLVRKEISLARLPEAFHGFRIVQLSDFHYDPHFSAHPLRKAIDVVNGLNPDLLVFTGDFITQPMFERLTHSNNQALAHPCAELLSQMKSRLGALAILGNHDLACCANEVAESLRDKNITVLINSNIPLEAGGARLWWAGVDDILEGHPDLDRAIHGIPPQEPVILLAHEPDYADEAAKHSIDLQLSGHSHGGQVRVPGLTSFILPPLGRKYPMGQYQIGPLTLYTNIGLGTVRLPVRFNCPPEITLITLKQKI